MKSITLIELKKIFDLIIKKLEFEELESIQISEDLYRYIPADGWDRFANVEIETGSLYDDIDCLKLLVANEDRPCTYVDFDRMASLLRAISQKNNPPYR